MQLLGGCTRALRSSADRTSRLGHQLWCGPGRCVPIQRFRTSVGMSAVASTTVTATAAARGVDSGSNSRLRLAVVGDVHGQWTSADAAALRVLQADAVLWVGDIGNEDVSLVQQIAALDDLDKAVILGNHDAWYTMTDRGRQRAARHKPQVTNATTSTTNSSSTSPSHQQQHEQQSAPPDRVQQQLDVLGDDHVGYAHKTLQGTNISIVGARPFSKGGKSFSSIADFMSRFGVADMQQSAEKVLDVIRTQVPSDNVLIMMAHNGPAGLGAAPHNICGVDWLPEAGDHGDPDLTLVLQQLQREGRKVALLLHGHMHHMIKGGGRRQMVAVDSVNDLLVLNAATVPRVVPLPHSNGSTATSRHHFLLVELLGGVPLCAADVWVQTEQQVPGDKAGSVTSDPAVRKQQQSFLASAASAMHAVQHSKAKGKAQKQAAAQAAQAEAVRRHKLQAPQQLQLQQQGGQVIDGFKVHVAEVYEVLRTVVDPQALSDTCAPPGDGDDGAVTGTEGRVHWQYFDAHLGKWVTPAEQAGAVAASLTATSSRDQQAVC